MNFRCLISSCLLVLLCSNLPDEIAFAASPEDCAKPNLTYFDCAQVILRSLNALPADQKDPAPVFKLAEIWDARFEKEYHQFLSGKNVKNSQSDYDKLKEEIGSKINPADIVQDEISENLKKKVAKWVAKRFKQLAPVVYFLESKIATLASTAIGAFLTPSEIATDWDERKGTNDQIQEEISKKMAPFFKPDWKVQFKSQVGPTLERMR